MDVADIILVDGPVCEVEHLAQTAKSFAGLLDCVGFEYCQRGLTLHETTNLIDLLHEKREEEWAVGNGSDVEAESESWGLIAGVGASVFISHCIFGFWVQRYNEGRDLGLIVIN